MSVTNYMKHLNVIFSIKKNVFKLYCKFYFWSFLMTVVGIAIAFIPMLVFAENLNILPYWIFNLLMIF